MTLDPDVCIMNYYDAEGRISLRQDKDESERSLAAGVPVVSVSSANRAIPVRRRQASRSRPGAPALVGDAFVFAVRPPPLSRRVPHHPGTAPPELGRGPFQPDVQAVHF